jgi:hypothetical protein
MADPNPNTCLLLTWTMGTSYSVSVTDSHSTRSVSVGTAATTTYWRTAFGLSGATGSTEASPKSLVNALQTALNAAPGSAFWTVTVTAGGYVKITYNGGAGAASITFTAAEVRNQLGFTGNLTFSAPAASQTASHQIPSAILSIARVNDTEFSPEPMARAVGATEDGKVYGWVNTSRRMLRKFDLRFHPLDATAKTSLSASGTPYRSATKSRWLAPSADFGQTPPWTLLDFFGAAGGTRLAGFFGNFQDAIAGTVTTYDAVYLTPDSLEERRPAKPSLATWNQRFDWNGVEVSFVAEETFAL